MIGLDLLKPFVVVISVEPLMITSDGGIKARAIEKTPGNEMEVCRESRGAK